MRSYTMLIRLLAIFYVANLFAGCQNQAEEGKSEKQASPAQAYAIAIHGGAGNTSEADFPEEKQKAYREKLQEALDKGVSMLENGSPSLDVVEAVIHILEDCPLFNAGKGAVFTHQGTNELDASIMDGRNLNAGAVAGVGDIRHPVSAARMVMEKSEHVMLAGAGASQFARGQGLEIVDSSYFRTEPRWESLQRALKAEKHGTVGCVVLDKQGNLAAGTSTGGRTNKKYGRIGDSPIIGAGTYANNASCAISATGHGEYFIRYAVAHDISALMRYKGLSLKEAADHVIKEKLVEAGGDGGIIGVDAHGNLTASFNTKLMFRALANADGKNTVQVFAD